MPPDFGIELARSAICSPALAADFTAASFIGSPVVRIAENDFIADPKATNLSPKLAISFSPAIVPHQPPSLGIVFAISAIILPALAAAVTALSSMPLTVFENATIDIPKGTNCKANSLSESPAPNHEAILSTNPAFVNDIINDTNVCALVKTDSSSNLTPVINGIRFIINIDKFVATSGSPDVIPCAIPPTKLPIILPSPFANLESKSIPESRNVSSCGNVSFNAPTATTNPAKTVITAVIAVIAVTPNNAKGPSIETCVSKLVIAVINDISTLAFASAF